jgi:hypothetical protein
LGDAHLHHLIQVGAGDRRVVVAITGGDGQRYGDALGDAEDQRGKYQEVIGHESPEQVELRPESGRGAEDHDDHEKPCGHVDRGVLGVARESRPHCGWICGGVGWGFFLPFHNREEGEAKGKLRAWSCREHALLRRAVVALLL